MAETPAISATVCIVTPSLSHGGLAPRRFAIVGLSRSLGVTERPCNQYPARLLLFTSVGPRIKRFSINVAGACSVVGHMLS